MLKQLFLIAFLGFSLIIHGTLASTYLIEEPDKNNKTYNIFESLPGDIIKIIFAKLPPNDKKNVRITNQQSKIFIDKVTCWHFQCVFGKEDNKEKQKYLIKFFKKSTGIQLDFIVDQDQKF